MKKIKYIIDKNNCWICTSHKLNSSGYPRITINKKQTTVHRYFYQQYKKNPEELIIRHTCDNPLCINPDHLVAGTHFQNVQDRVERNRSAKEESNGRSKLTKSQVFLIKYNSENYTKTFLATKYGVSRKVIYSIQNRITWKNV
jgi:hypothetical protein